ncbi:MAG: ABC transporter permease [Gemmatimonadota bacterium]|nr:ABC transporter permease [Gemmatimonadota bacterium]
MRLTNRIYTSLEGIIIAFESIRTNKVRAGLTIMGVAVGVFVVVAMSGAVHGIKASVERDIAAAGPTSFFVFRRGDFFERCDGSEDSCPSRRNPPITLREAAMLQRLPTLHTVAAHVSGSAPFKFHDRELSSAHVDAYSANWTDVDGGDINPGRSFTAAEALTGTRVLIVNDKMAERLFPNSDPVGRVVLVNSIPFQVIGVYHSTVSFIGTPTQSGGDEAKGIVPLESARRYLDVWMRGMDLTVKPRETVPRERAMDDVTAALRSARGVQPGANNNFAVVGQDLLLEKFNGFTRNFFLIMIALASVGLLVGGVGVIAIMMISVTERTREIGVRKALGATRGTILWQFLVEAATLTAIGAFVGLVIGTGVVMLIHRLTPVPAEVPPGAIIAALAGSAFTGIIFGMLPAMRAARLDPVDALRYE